MTELRSSVWVWIERVANVGILVLGCVGGWQLLTRSNVPPPPPEPEIVRAGDTITLDSNESDDPYSLVVVFRSTCAYCNESLPFYRELVGISRQSVLFVSSSHDVAATRRALSGGGLDAARIATANFKANRLHVTPLVLSVNQAGRVRTVWRGRVRHADQAEIRAALTTSSKVPSGDRGLQNGVER